MMWRYCSSLVVIWRCADRLRHFAFRDHGAGAGEDCEHLEAPVPRSSVRTRDWNRKSPTSTVAGLPKMMLAAAFAAPQFAAVHDIIVQQRGGVDEFDRRSELVMARALVAHQFRAGERQTSDAAACPLRRSDVRQGAGSGGISLCIRSRITALTEFHARRGQRQHGIECRCLTRQRDNIGTHVAAALGRAQYAWQAAELLLVSRAMPQKSNFARTLQPQDPVLAAYRKSIDNIDAAFDPHSGRNGFGSRKHG